MRCSCIISVVNLKMHLSTSFFKYLSFGISKGKIPRGRAIISTFQLDFSPYLVSVGDEKSNNMWFGFIYKIVKIALV